MGAIVIRGGSWYRIAMRCRSADSSKGVPGIRYYDLGFRLALAKKKKQR